MKKMDEKWHSRALSTPGRSAQGARAHPAGSRREGRQAHFADQTIESGQSQPTLDAIRKLALALRVSADMLLFEKDERGPDEDLKLQFEVCRGWTRRRRRLFGL
jgi:hypothetical protein